MVQFRAIGMAATIMVAVSAVVPVVSGAAGGRKPAWRIVQLQPNTGFTSDPAVAVARSGRAVVAWDAGVPPEVCFAAIPPRPCGSPAQLRIMATLGRLPGRLGTGALVASVPTGVVTRPYVGVAGNGTAYVAWQDSPRGDWVVAVAARGRFSSPRPLGIPPSAQLQELAGAGAGPVAAVWLQYGLHSAPAYRYALLRRDGRIRHTVTIAHLGSPLETVAFAINDRGAVAASWVNNGGRFRRHARVSAVLCTAGHCGRRQTILFRRATGQNVTLSTTISDSGTATVVITSFDTSPGYTYGLQAAVSHRGASFRSAGYLATSAERQAATGVGADGVVTLFPQSATIANWTQLTPHGFTAPRVLDQRDVGPEVASGNSRGNVVLAWINSPGGVVTDTSNSIRASLGTIGSLPAPQTIAPNSRRVDGGYLAGGIDGHGDAIIVWNEFIDSQSRGVFASIGQL